MSIEWKIVATNDNWELSDIEKGQKIDQRMEVILKSAGKLLKRTIELEAIVGKLAYKLSEKNS